MDKTPTIPLFPLGAVLLPGNALPLHIFEERYKRLVRRCIDERREFGIVHADGAALRGKGCTARCVGVLNQAEDGRFDVLCSGNRRFEILDRRDEGDELRAAVRFFDDEPEPAVLVNGLAMAAIELIEDLAAQAGARMDRAALHRMSPQALSFVLANTELFSADQRQELLEATLCSRRLEAVAESARRALARMASNRRLRGLLGARGELSHLLN